MFAVLYWVCYNRFTSLIITVTSFRFAASEVNRGWTITCAETARLFFLPLNVEVLITPTNVFCPPAIKWHNIWWLSTIFTFVETKSLFINTVLDVTILTNSWKYIYKQFHFSKDIQGYTDQILFSMNIMWEHCYWSIPKVKKICIDLVKISEAAVANYPLRYSKNYTIRKGWIFTLFQSLTLTSLLMKTWMQNKVSRIVISTCFIL